MHLFLILSTNKHDRVRKKERWKGSLFICTLSAPNSYFIADESDSSLFIVIVIIWGFTDLLPTRLNLGYISLNSVKHSEYPPSMRI